MLLDAICDHLQANGIGTAGVNLFKSFMPDSPDFAIAIYEYSGRPADKAFGTVIVIENARFQIIVRSDQENTTPNAYSTAREKAEDIQTLLDGAAQLMLSGVPYFYIEALEPPFALQRDENHRVLIACNYEARKGRG